MIALDDRKGMALRHVNVPLLLGCLALQIASDRVSRRKAATQDWDELAAGLLQWAVDV